MLNQVNPVHTFFKRSWLKCLINKQYSWTMEAHRFCVDLHQHLKAVINMALSVDWSSHVAITGRFLIMQATPHLKLPQVSQKQFLKLVGDCLLRLVAALTNSGLIVINVRLRVLSQHRCSAYYQIWRGEDRMHIRSFWIVSVILISSISWRSWELQKRLWDKENQNTSHLL